MKLRFHKLSAASDTDEWGEIALHKNGMVQFSASDGLRTRLLRTADRVDRAALMYGAGTFMGIAAVGTALVVKRKTVWGYLFLVLAALIALAGAHVRSVARNASRVFDNTLDKKDVSAELSLDGSLVIVLGDRSGQGTTLRLEPGEFNQTQATKLVAALRV